MALLLLDTKTEHPFNMNMLVAILDDSHCQKSQKMTTMTLSLKINTYNEN